MPSHRSAGAASARGSDNNSGGGGSGFDVGEVMAYVGAAFGSANADVRAAALHVTVVAAEQAGPVPVRRLLPQSMNPKMRQQVESALGVEAAAAAPAPQPAGGVLSPVCMWRLWRALWGYAP